MSIANFMNKNISIIKNEIIAGIQKEEFDSHEFIRSFSHKFETDYVKYLYEQEVEPFRIIHAQIARFLSENQESLKIRDAGKINSLNIFGIVSPNEKWIKTL